MPDQEIETLKRISKSLSPARHSSSATSTFIWDILLPLVAINVFLVGYIQLARQPGNLTEVLPLFGLAVATMVFFTKDAQHQRWFGASHVILTLVATTQFDPIIGYGVGVAGMVLLAVLITRSDAGKHAFWWSAIYLPIIFGVFEPSSSLLLFGVTSAMFGVCSLIFYRAKISSGMFAALFGVALDTIAEARLYEDAVNLQATIIFIVILAAIIYEVKTPSRNASNLRYFLTDGLILALVAVLLGIKVDEFEDGVTLWAAFAILYSFGRASTERFKVPGRLSWAALGMIALVLLHTDDENTMFLAILICTGLHSVGLALRSKFVSRSAALILVVQLLSIHLSGEEVFWIHLSYQALLATLLVLIIVQSSNFRPYQPFWKGVIRARHVVRIRQTWRIVERLIEKIPIVGLLVTVPKGLLNWLGYIRQDGPSKFWDDVISLVTQLLFVLILTNQLRLYGDSMGWDQHLHWYARAIVWMGWGVCVSGLGRTFGSSFHRSLAATFVLVPTMMEIERWIELDRLAPEAPEFYYSFMFMTGGSLIAVLAVNRLGRTR